MSGKSLSSKSEIDKDLSHLTMKVVIEQLIFPMINLVVIKKHLGGKKKKMPIKNGDDDNYFLGQKLWPTQFKRSNN